MTEPTPTKSKKKQVRPDVVEYTSFGKVNLSQNARILASLVTVQDPKKKSKSTKPS